MPYSSTLLDDVALQVFSAARFDRLLDIGAGAGKYGRMIAAVRPDVHRTALEVWTPYVEQFNLPGLYHDVQDRDGRDLMRDVDQTFDLVTLGDVLEHLPKSDGIDLLEFLIYRSRLIWVQVPRRYLQGSVEGNPHEAHVSIWSERDFAPYEHVAYPKGDMLGVALWGWRAPYAEWYAGAHGLRDAFLPSIDPARALELRARHGLTAFVETGIWHGGTTWWAAREFGRVHAIDLDPRWANHARARLRDYTSVEIQAGDSRPFLLNLLRELDTPALLYLDAHYIADKKSAGSATDCPLLGELAAVRVAPVRHVVVIDDARLIVNRDPDYLAWPTLEEVRAALPGWAVTHEGRALICTPEAA